jgi:hypothetical protein
MQNTAVVQTSMLALTDSQLAQLVIAATVVTAQGTPDRAVRFEARCKRAEAQASRQGLRTMLRCQ